jgi:isoleucyl-tRNA synthetase
MTTFPAVSDNDGSELREAWARLFSYREVVLAKLEEARIAKLIGSSLEARVEIAAGRTAYELLNQHRNDLRYVFIVSAATVTADESLPVDELRVTVGKAAGSKCERCWNYSERVGKSSRYPTVCERCVAALAELDEDGE